MRTTLRFTSVVAGVAALILLAAVILSGKDWLSTSPGVNQRLAVQTSVPAPQARAPAPPAGAAAPQATAPAPPSGADSRPSTAPAATVSTPRPLAAVVQATAGQAPTGRAAAGVARADEEDADRPAGDGRGDRGHLHGGDRSPASRSRSRSGPATR